MSRKLIQSLGSFALASLAVPILGHTAVQEVKPYAICSTAGSTHGAYVRYEIYNPFTKQAEVRVSGDTGKAGERILPATVILTSWVEITATFLDGEAKFDLKTSSYLSPSLGTVRNNQGEVTTLACSRSPTP